MGNSQSHPIIPVIPISGIISPTTGCCFKKVNAILEKTFRTHKIHTLALLINSPGGSPVQCEYMVTRIRALAKKHNVKVLAFIQDVAASGGYYIACAADEIYASSSSIVGSVGVISSGFGLDKFIENHGIERRIYAQGDNKALLDPFLPQKPSDVEILNSIGKDIHSSFIDIVKRSRGSKLDLEYSGLFTGEVWSGSRAKELGLIDDTGDMYSILQSKFGPNVQISYMEEKKSFLSKLTGSIGILTNLCSSLYSSIFYPM